MVSVNKSWPGSCCSIQWPQKTKCPMDLVGSGGREHLLFRAPCKAWGPKEIFASRNHTPLGFCFFIFNYWWQQLQYSCWRTGSCFQLWKFCFSLDFKCHYFLQSFLQRVVNYMNSHICDVFLKFSPLFSTAILSFLNIDLHFICIYLFERQRAFQPAGSLPTCPQWLGLG